MSRPRPYRLPRPGSALLATWRQGYGFAELRRDLMAGLTIGIVALWSLAEELRSQRVGLIFIGMPARMVMKLRRAGLYREAGRLAAVRHLDHARRLAGHWLEERWD